MYLKVRTLKSVAKRVIHITSFRCSFRRVNFNGLDLDINIPFVPDFSVWGPSFIINTITLEKDLKFWNLTLSNLVNLQKNYLLKCHSADWLHLFLGDY